MYDLIIELGSTIAKHGLSLSALGTALFVLLKQRKVKRLLHKRLPWLLRDDSDVLNYRDRQIRIESKLDALMGAGGIKWDANSQSGKTVHRLITGQQKKSLLQQAAYAHAIIAKYFTPLKETYHSLQRRMSMKSKLLSRKFLMAVISAALVIANDGLNLGLDQNTIIAFGSIVVGYIAVEGATDIAKKPEVSAYDRQKLDSVRQDSEDSKYTASN